MGIVQSNPVSRKYGESLTPEWVAQEWVTMNRFEREDACRSLRKENCNPPCVLNFIKLAPCRSARVVESPGGYIEVTEQPKANCPILASPESSILNAPSENAEGELTCWPYYIAVAVLGLLIGVCLGALYMRKKIRGRQQNPAPIVQQL